MVPFPDQPVGHARALRLLVVERSADPDSGLLLEPAEHRFGIDLIDRRIGDHFARGRPGSVRAGPDQYREQDGKSGGESRASHFAYRSEEHTSELQSLMRNSYAVFCLKKKKHTREAAYCIERHY